MTTGNFWRGFGLLPAVLMLTSPALAQSGTAPAKASAPAAATPGKATNSSGDDVVITVKPVPKPKEVEHQARALTRLDNFYTEPLARFEDPICPGILGLPVDIAELLVDRIRYDAQRLKIDVAKENSCQPNILIAFAKNGQAVIKLLAKSRGYMFSRISVAELNELSADPGPVHAWSNTVFRTRDGMDVQGSEEGGGSPPVMKAPMADSKIFTAHRVDILSSIVVIDMAATEGLTTDQIADYAVMRSLARMRPAAGDAAADTILSLFDPGNGARAGELTGFDMAYLHSLYTGHANLPASAKIGNVASAMPKKPAAAMPVSAPAAAPAPDAKP